MSLAFIGFWLLVSAAIVGAAFEASALLGLAVAVYWVWLAYLIIRGPEHPQRR